jgi:cysteine-rich repeat protein
VRTGFEECDDGNGSNTDGCLNSCKLAKCGDGFVRVGVEECDDGNQVNNDACTNTCKKPAACGDLLTTWNGWSYYKVTVNGSMTDVNVRAACEACALKVPCQATAGCMYNDNICLQTNNETVCGDPMVGLANKLCGLVPSSCPQLYDTYQYMGNAWELGSACGAKSGAWCVDGFFEVDQEALCVKPK